MVYNDPEARRAAQRALESLRDLLASLKDIWTYAQVEDEKERAEWAEKSIAAARET